MEGFGRMGEEWKKKRGKTISSDLEEGDRMWFLAEECENTDVSDVRVEERRTQTWNYFPDMKEQVNI